MLRCRSVCGDRISSLFRKVLIQALGRHKLSAQNVNIIELPGAVFEHENEGSDSFIARIVGLWSPLVKHVDDGAVAVSSRRDNRVSCRWIPRSDKRAVARIVGTISRTFKGLEFVRTGVLY